MSTEATTRKSSDTQHHGILHHSTSATRRASAGIAWNETNLEENEKIKAALPKCKISEPKTPYHTLLPDEDIELEPLALDGQAAGALQLTGSLPLPAAQFVSSGEASMHATQVSKGAC
jgi:hypothetical protein